MSNCNNIDKVLKRHGTSQNERFITQLNPENFELNDFNVEDWILFAYNFAKHVNYYKTSDSNTPHGDWQDFFNCFDFVNTDIFSRESEIKEYNLQKEQISKVLSSFKEAGELTPHLTLFVCFLQLLEQTKKRFNKITKRHLDFYFKNVLQVNKRAAIPDKVHVLFELAKKSIQVQIAENSELNANKDSNGTPLIYKTSEELIANQAMVASLKTIYNDLNLKELKSSGVANTLDGAEEPLPKEMPYWLPFGYPSTENKFKELPDATVGFAISSPMFLLQEGKRTVTITLTFDSDITNNAKTTWKESNLEIGDFSKVISIFGSGKKEWIDVSELAKDDVATFIKTTITSSKTLEIEFQLGKDIPAIVNYNDEVLIEKYNTTFPVFRFNINMALPEGYNFFRALGNATLHTIKINVDVKEAKSLHIENDNGILKAEKPFFPFTSQPIKKSNFYINYEEAFKKAWKNITINFSWKNTPDDFVSWYEAYLKPSISRGKVSIFRAALQKELIAENKIVKSDAYFTAETAILHSEEWDVVEKKKILFLADEDKNSKVKLGYKCHLAFNNPGENYPINKAGPLRLSLNESFLQELFPHIYALTITAEGINDIVIPNQPYVPMAEAITLNYSAEETRIIKQQLLPINQGNPLEYLNTEEAYKKERIKLFHIHPFGQCEEHNYLKTKLQIKGIKDAYDTTQVKTRLVPTYCGGGELFIGLTDAHVLQNIALLIQVLEGSENPQADSFEDQEDIQWAVLCRNKWKSLKDDILTNSTGKFLSSGIIKFTIPREATSDNTRLPEGYIWIRAKMHKDYNAVCKVINIHTQAVLSTFDNRSNEFSHLLNGLPADTIKKLITRVPQVKGVSQPYSSFGGIPEETDENFYRRISERLRHKNRAITMWDYEHLILQKFPEIYKIKCLNHTNVPVENNTAMDCYVAAGNVTLIVIPDTKNKNMFDNYQPRVSKGLINRIKMFINQHNTLHINTNVINPRYEEVKVALEVQFHEGYDKTFYSKQLELDITKFLSPWAFDTTKEIVFGIDLHKSVLIDYLEKLIYVDYIQNVILKNSNGQDLKNVVSPTNPRSILVSSKIHEISTDLTPCKGEKPQTNQICQ
ncbi:baseplate J/gp47 family protein [Mariniflexile sp.]|uniref:baseplate J/gp47 family protein n=1 Tax=Mariniflexile sp. TaxID=1979402 RepID=UPI003565A04C